MMLRKKKDRRDTNYQNQHHSYNTTTIHAAFSKDQNRYYKQVYAQFDNIVRKKSHEEM